MIKVDLSGSNDTGIPSSPSPTQNILPWVRRTQRTRRRRRLVLMIYVVVDIVLVIFSDAQLHDHVNEQVRTVTYTHTVLL